MLKLLGAVVLLTLASRCHSVSRSWAVPFNSKEFLVPGTLFFTDVDSFPFGTCKKSSETEILCNVTMVTPGKPDRHCPNVRVFAGEGRQLFLDGYFQLTPFAKNHIIVGWWDNTGETATAPKKSFINVGILNMKRCSTEYLHFPVDKTGYGLFPAELLYPDQISVILYNKQKCETSDVCRLNYDLKGEQIGGPKPYLSNLIGYASPVSANRPKKGYFVTVQELNNLTVLLVDLDGKANKLMTDKFEDGITKQRVAFSNAHELYSVCRLPVIHDKKPTKIHCTQFDSKGLTVLKNEVTIPETVGWLSVRNLPEGGFILATSACNHPSVNDENCQGFNVYKIDKNGHQSKPANIENKNLQCFEAPESKPDHSELNVHIYENKNEFCFDFACLQSNTLNYTSKCVSQKTIKEL